MKVSKEKLAIIPDLFRLFYVAMRVEGDVMELLKIMRIIKPILRKLFEIYIYLRKIQKYAPSFIIINPRTNCCETHISTQSFGK
jgi:hypothetical protein